jgi:hypothetical protein
MTTDDFPPGSADGQVWLWDASAGAWVLRVLTAADVGALPDSYAPAWGDVTGKPSTYPPESHTHPWGDVTGKPSTYPPESHTHPWGDVTGKPSTYPPESHTHYTQHSLFVSGKNNGTVIPSWPAWKSMAFILVRMYLPYGLLGGMVALANKDGTDMTVDVAARNSNMNITASGTNFRIYNYSNHIGSTTLKIQYWGF